MKSQNFILCRIILSCFAFVLVVFPRTAYCNSGPDVKLKILSIKNTDKGFAVVGNVTGSNLNPKGQIVESDSVSIIADIETGGNVKYPLLPQSMYVRSPAGSETPYTKGSGPGATMTQSEYRGVGITSIVIFRVPLRETPVWKAYGGLSDWTKNAPSQVTKDVDGYIPEKYKGKNVRIRALLEHRWGGPYANWPAFSYANDIGYKGKLDIDKPTTTSGTTGTQTTGSGTANNANSWSDEVVSGNAGGATDSVKRKKRHRHDMFVYKPIHDIGAPSLREGPGSR